MATLSSLTFNPADPYPGLPVIDCVLRIADGPLATRRTVTITPVEFPNTPGEMLINNFPATIEIPAKATGVVFAVETNAGTAGGTVQFTVKNGVLGTVSENLIIVELVGSGPVDTMSIPLSVVPVGVPGSLLTTTNDTVQLTVTVPGTPGDPTFAALLAVDKPLMITYGQFMQDPMTAALFPAAVLSPEVELMKPQRIEAGRMSVTFPVRVKANLDPGVYYVSVGISILQGNPPYTNAILIRFEKLMPGP